MTSTLSIDINCDMGERPESLADGQEEELMKFVTSVNIACGGHAGDQATMHAVVRLAQQYGVAVGAHPGYPDRVNFGRIDMSLDYETLKNIVFEQVQLLATVAKREGAFIRHVKPHGALYHRATRDSNIAQAIAEGVRPWSSEIVLIGLAGSSMLRVWREMDFRVAGEAFADRAYEGDGSLRSRNLSDSLVTDPEKAAEQALRIVKDHAVLAVGGSEIQVEAETICIHSDTPNASLIARHVRETLSQSGVSLERLRWSK